MTSQKQSFIVAVDAGGTHTRVGCFGLDGELVASAVGEGGSPLHNKDPEANVSRAVNDCLQAGEINVSSVIGLAAGMSEIRPGQGRDQESSTWAKSYFSMFPESCKQVFVSDSVAAQRGAFLGQPGIMVVAGTGSRIVGITPDGHEIENGWFEHYAGAARRLAMDAVQLILLGAGVQTDAAFVSNVYSYWGVRDIDGLRSTILDLRNKERKEVMALYGRLAPVVTAAADTSPLAGRALKELCVKTARGVQVIAPYIDTKCVPVALAGAVARTEVFARRLELALNDESGAVRTKIVEPSLDPLRGAAIIAFEAVRIPLDAPLISRLSDYPREL